MSERTSDKDRKIGATERLASDGGPFQFIAGDLALNPPGGGRIDDEGDDRHRSQRQQNLPACKPVEDRRDDRRRGNGDDPGDRDIAGNSPAYRRSAASRTGADNASGNRVRGGNR